MRTSIRLLRGPRTLGALGRAAALLLLAASSGAQARPQLRSRAERRPYTDRDAARALAEPSDRFLAAIARDSVRRLTVTHRVLPTMEMLNSMVLDIPEYHDEQQLSDGAGGLGPTAYVFASPYLSGFTSINQIDAQGTFGAFAATLWVDAPSGTNLPTTYTALNLVPGLNCVFIAHQGPSAVTGWSAYILPGTVGAPCPRPTSAVPKRVVRHFRSAPDTAQAAYPGAARFGEDVLDRPTVGLRCLNAWCDIGSGTASLPIRPPSHAGDHYLMSFREGRIHGWHDDQMLTQVGPGNKLVPVIRATVTPVPGLQGISQADYTKFWVRVATIWLATDPTGTKYGPPTAAMPKTWGMRKGLNALEIAFDGTNWQAQVTPALADGRIDPSVAPTRLSIRRTGHFDVPVPGTARFRWRMDDDSVWIDCDQGCCRVDALAL